MEKKSNLGLFVNVVSFLERFKQIQQQHKEQGATLVLTTCVFLEPVNNSKSSLTIRNDIAPAPTNDKFTFSLKQNSKLLYPPIKLGSYEDEKRGLDKNSKRLMLEEFSRPRVKQ